MMAAIVGSLAIRSIESSYTDCVCGTAIITSITITVNNNDNQRYKLDNAEGLILIAFIHAGYTVVVNVTLQDNTLFLLHFIVVVSMLAFS